MRSVKKPWGRFEEFARNAKVTVKLLHIERGCRLSLQYHRKRREFWQVVSGRVVATIGKVRRTLEEGQSVQVSRGVQHRIGALVDSIVLEIATGAFDEADIVRLADDYGRTARTKP